MVFVEWPIKFKNKLNLYSLMCASFLGTLLVLELTSARKASAIRWGCE